MPFQFGRLIRGFFGSHIQKVPFQIAQRSLTSITFITLIFQDNPIVIPSGSLPSDADPNCRLSSRWTLSKEQCLSSSYFERSAERIHFNFDWSLCSFSVGIYPHRTENLTKKTSASFASANIQVSSVLHGSTWDSVFGWRKPGERSSLGLGPWI